MKKATIYAITALIFSSCFLRQSTHQNDNKIKPITALQNDTLTYIKINFIERKMAYIGKPLNTLFKDLKIPIKSYMLGTNMKKSNEIPDMSFSFINREELTTKIIDNQEPLIIHISFQTPLSREFTTVLGQKTDWKWTKEVEKYYGKQIIKNLLLTDYEIGKKKN